MSVVFTAFECDRCASINATRIPAGDKHIDLCGRCIVILVAILLRKIPKEDFESWLKSFIDGIIE